MSHRLTAEEMDAAARELVARTCAAQGIPEKVTDLATLNKVVTLMHNSSTPASSRLLPEALADGRPAPAATTAERHGATPPSPLGSPTGGPALDQVPPGRRGRATTPPPSAA